MDQQLANMGGIDGSYLVSLITLMGLLIIGSYTELQDKRLPNWLTMSGLVVGLMVGAVPGGITLASSVSGFLAGFLFLFIFFLFGGMGGGDVKMLGAVGALQGYPLILNTIVYTTFIGCAMAIWVLVANRHFWRGLYQSLAMVFRRKKPEEETTEENEKKLGTVPFGMAIIGGASLTIFLSML